MKEIWKDIIGYEGAYMVSNLGGVKNLRRKGKKLKKCHTADGYYCVNLCVNNKRNRQRIHRLVGIAFIPNTENKPEINHKNGIKTDNNIHNLEWVTSSENQKHAFRTGLQKPTRPWLGKTGKLHHASKPVIQLSKEGVFIENFESTHDVMRKTGFNFSFIARCCRNDCKTAKGFIWKYAK